MSTSKSAGTMKNKKKHPRAGFTGRRMLYIMLGVSLLLIMFLIVAYPLVMTGAPATAVIRIPRNATEANVRDSLAKHFGDDYAGIVMRAASLRHIDYSKRHGSYEIKEGTSPLYAMRKLTSGAQTPVRITINGYRSLPLLLENVADKFEFSVDSLAEALYDKDFLARYDLTPDNAMAIFINDTYEVYWSASPQEVLEKFGKNYRYLWNEGNRAKAAQLGLKPAQVMIVASIVDEETNTQAEKGTVGRLYVNRLHKGMRLQADPTVRFALGDFTIQRISNADLNVTSPYNTYRNDGLPPGPIRTIDKRTVQSILDSKPHDYLYMCARETLDGTHNFAETFEEHTRNALKYRQTLDRLGISR